MVQRHDHHGIALANLSQQGLGQLDRVEHVDRQHVGVDALIVHPLRVGLDLFTEQADEAVGAGGQQEGHPAQARTRQLGGGGVGPVAQASHRLVDLGDGGRAHPGTLVHRPISGRQADLCLLRHVFQRGAHFWSGFGVHGDSLRYAPQKWPRGFYQSEGKTEVRHSTGGQPLHGGAGSRRGGRAGVGCRGGRTGGGHALTPSRSPACGAP